jgi:molecular chaperone DnaK (HSP70)
MAISIDFGTSNTVIARWNPATQQAETISLPGLSLISAVNPPLIPSLVYVHNAATADLAIGQAVRDRGLDVASDQRSFAGFKRGIGAQIQGFLPELDGQQITFEQVGSWFLQQVWQAVDHADYSDESLVVTVPVDSFDTYRSWLGQVCQQLAIAQVSLLDESTAAALGYGLDQGLILVVDCGGGTIDLSLVQLVAKPSQQLGFLLKFGNKVLDKSAQKPQLAKVIAKAGQNLGGTDIDRWIAEYLATAQDLRVTSLILRLAEQLKIQLSSATTATEVFFDDRELETYEFQLTRVELEQILRDRSLFNNLDELLKSLQQQIERASVSFTDVDAVLLVGGTAQMPAIQNWIAQHFAPHQIKQFKPFEAIAHGALQITQGLEVQDFLYHSYGIRYWDRRQNRHNWHRLINAGQPYPMNKPVELLLGASQANQPSVELIIGELGTETGGTEIYFDGDRLVTRNLAAGVAAVRPLNEAAEAKNIAQLNPPGFPGSDRLRVGFTIDPQRCLRLTVYDLLTSQNLVEDVVVAELR